VPGIQNFKITTNGHEQIYHSGSGACFLFCFVSGGQSFFLRSRLAKALSTASSTVCRMPSKSICRLLNGVTGIIKGYEAQWQKTGEKYNIFEITGIKDDEVKVCRVLADLMNPKGAHGQGSRYLRPFWETIAPKLPGLPALDIEHTKVTFDRLTENFFEG
jgi:hypothetical protein